MFYVVLLCFFTLYISKPIFIFEQVRHGARGSVIVGKEDLTDVYSINWDGNAELTNIGLRMHYLIGALSRNKYKNFLSKKYNPKEIHVISTDLSRTIQSAQAQLLGMFPPESAIPIDTKDINFTLPPGFEEDNDINEASKSLNNNSVPFNMTIIPIKLFHEGAQKYLLTEPKVCPSMKAFRNENMYNKGITSFMVNFNKTYGEKILKLLNIKDKNYLFNYYNMLGITDHFISAYTHNKLIHKFTKVGIDPEDFLVRCKEYKVLSLFTVESSDKIALMAMSPTLKALLRYMENKINLEIQHNSKAKIEMDVENNDFSKLKMIIYSAHDSNIVTMEQYLKVTFGLKTHYPEFAANQFFELHKKEHHYPLTTDSFYVEYYYNGHLDLNVSYNEFRKKIEEKLWSDDRIESFCNTSQKDSIRIVSLISLIISIFGILLIMYCKRIKSEPTGNNQELGQRYESI